MSSNTTGFRDIAGDDDVGTTQAPTDLPVLSHSLSHTSATRPHPSAEHDPEKPSSASSDDDEGPEVEYPEGGRGAWTVVFGSCISMIASFGVMNTIGTLHAHLSEHQLSGHSTGEIGWIFGMYSFLSFFGGIQIGPIFDAFGPRALLVLGTVCLVVGLMLFSISTVYWHFMLSFGVLCGIGTSLIFTPAVASVGHWFLQKRAYATGVATTGGSIGGIIFPLVIQAAIPSVGFGWAIRIVGFIVLTFLILGNVLIKARTSIINPPSSSSTSANNKSSLRHAITSVKIDLTAFADPRFSLTTVGVFMIEWAVFIPITYLTSYSLHLGLPYAFSYQMLAILNVGSVFGRWLPGLVADKTGRFNIMLLTCSFCLLTVLSLWLPAAYIPTLVGKQSVMTLFALLYGFGSGSGISLTPVCVGQICNTREYGTKYGTCYFFVSFATLTGIPIAGQIVAASSGGYQGLIAFTAASYVGALLAFAAARYVGLGMKRESRGWRGIY
ncbi:major facilitator superfamily domain-containing protein [Tricharina praecox]|uniref:major facilitator superfamily domain-containing protein n=1 Tax=Tricharina praecox TaxID=43433 RepID=UPI00221F13B6|nr:major facilitator superfamily domain-containing protein [Tricharina praecox]KAI5859086.1 major facilitator superfamily domain-containing protein [Tricharina praecox]